MQNCDKNLHHFQQFLGVICRKEIWRLPMPHPYTLTLDLFAPVKYFWICCCLQVGCHLLAISKHSALRS